MRFFGNRVSVHEIEFVVEEHERKVDGVNGHADDADVLEYEEQDEREVHVPYTRHRRAGKQQGSSTAQVRKKHSCKTK